MDPVPAYTDKSFEERVNEVNELALHLKDSFSSAKFHLAKLDEALADPTVATVPKFTEIQEVSDLMIHALIKPDVLPEIYESHSRLPNLRSKGSLQHQMFVLHSSQESAH